MDLLEYLAEKNLTSYDDIKTHLTQFNLKVKSGINDKSNLYILMYDQIFADFNNKFMLNCRGLILEKETNKIICYPFDKFFNHGEKFAKSIDWTTSHCMEKVDGSFIKLYFYNDMWHVASNGCVDATEATLANGYTVRQLFDKIIPNSKELFSLLDPNYTYMFELVHPINCIVVLYGEPELVYLGARNISTYVECTTDQLPLTYKSIRNPRKFAFDVSNPHSSIMEYLKTTKWSDEEGFVVSDDKFNRVKIKSADYVAQHLNISSLGKVENKLSYALAVVLDGEEDEIEANSKQGSRSSMMLVDVVKLFDPIKTQLASTITRISNIVLDVKLQNPNSDPKTMRGLIARELKKPLHKITPPEFNLGLVIFEHPLIESQTELYWIKMYEISNVNNKAKFRDTLFNILEKSNLI